MLYCAALCCTVRTVLYCVAGKLLPNCCCICVSYILIAHDTFWLPSPSLDARASLPAGVLGIKFCQIYVDTALLRKKQYVWRMRTPLTLLTFKCKHLPALAEWVWAAREAVFPRDKQEEARRRCVCVCAVVGVSRAAVERVCAGRCRLTGTCLYLCPSDMLQGPSDLLERLRAEQASLKTLAHVLQNPDGFGSFVKVLPTQV